MNKSPTLYEALGLKPGVTASEIKRAYRNLVKDYHPDLSHSRSSEAQFKQANERMRNLNEAYSTLINRSKRAAYDLKIGLLRVSYTYATVSSSRSEEEACKRFIKTIFNPARRAIYTQLRKYPHQLRVLSGDIYDEKLLANFERYVEDLEEILLSCSSSISNSYVPSLLEAGVRMIRYSLAQAADGLDEIRYFYSNFDYDHLIMAGNLFRISLELSAESARLVKI